jgi:hypothetical protein
MMPALSALARSSAPSLSKSAAKASEKLPPAGGVAAPTVKAPAPFPNRSLYVPPNSIAARSWLLSSSKSPRANALGESPTGIDV